MSCGIRRGIRAASARKAGKSWASSLRPSAPSYLYCSWLGQGLENRDRRSGRWLASGAVGRIFLQLVAVGIQPPHSSPRISFDQLTVFFAAAIASPEHFGALQVGAVLYPLFIKVVSRPVVHDHQLASRK